MEEIKKASSVLRVALIESAPTGHNGSMSRYGALVSHAMKIAQAGLHIEIVRINLALPLSIQQHIPAKLRNWIHHAWIMLTAKSKLAKVEADIFHLLDGSHGYVINQFPRATSVATSHDIIPLLEVHGNLGKASPGRLARWLIRRSINGLQQADGVISDSMRTCADLSHFTGINMSHVSVVNPAIPLEIMREATAYPGQLWGERGDSKAEFIFHIGNAAFYKNRPGVLRIFSKVRRACNIRLKMAGPAPTSELQDIVSELGLVDDVDFIINPTDHEVAELYRKASLFIFPSHYEGFGWPPLEAMVFGCPVVCSSEGSLSEVVGDAALTCASDDEEGLARHCIDVLQNPDIAENLIERGYQRVEKFSVERMGQELLDIYTHLVTGQKLREPTMRSYVDS